MIQICKSEQCLTCIKKIKAEIVQDEDDDVLDVICSLEIDGVQEIEADSCPQYARELLADTSEDDDELRTVDVGPLVTVYSPDVQFDPSQGETMENIKHTYILLEDGQLVRVGKLRKGQESFELEDVFVDAYNKAWKDLDEARKEEILTVQSKFEAAIQSVKDKLGGPAEELRVSIGSLDPDFVFGEEEADIEWDEDEDLEDEDDEEGSGV